jgi:spermidine/putrescine transport system substrate-binding protein
MLDPEVNAREVLAHGYPVADSRTNALLPEEILNDPILYPGGAARRARVRRGGDADRSEPGRAFGAVQVGLKLAGATAR